MNMLLNITKTVKGDKLNLQMNHLKKFLRGVLRIKRNDSIQVAQRACIYVDGQSVEGVPYIFINFAGLFHLLKLIYNIH